GSGRSTASAAAGYWRAGSARRARSARAARRICSASRMRRSASRFGLPSRRAIRLASGFLGVDLAARVDQLAEIEVGRDEPGGEIADVAAGDVVEAQAEALVDLVERHAHRPQVAGDLHHLGAVLLQR